MLISAVIPTRNAANQTKVTLRELTSASQKSDLPLEVIIVDDGSDEAEVAALRGLAGPNVHVVEHDACRGRAWARNTGVQKARGNYILMLDCDCIPRRRDFLKHHLDMLKQEADASIGDVMGLVSGFWGRYQSEAAIRRKYITQSGNTFAYTLTTANMMLKRKAFNKVNGFDIRYRHYGFEDRDFLLRLQASGARLRHNPNATVTHSAEIDLSSVCLKLRECGQHSAPLFRKEHPSAYRKLGYAAVDASLKPWLKPIGGLLAPISTRLANRIDRWVRRETWPFPVRAAVARGIIAIAYLEGTRLSSKVQP